MKLHKTTRKRILLFLGKELQKAYFDRDFVDEKSIKELITTVQESN